MLTLVIVTVFVALLFDFLNGMNDAANSIATIVSTRVLSPRLAVLWAAFFNFFAVGIGLVFGFKVAGMIGKGIVDPDTVNAVFILSALLGAVFWTWICTRLGLPISVSHALVGGLIGTAIAQASGFSTLMPRGILLIGLFIVVAPVMGGILGYIFMIAVMWMFRKARPRKVNDWFRKLQLLSAAFYSLGHGLNDAQKTMGIITVLLFSTGYLEKWFGFAEFQVTWQVAVASSLAISLGTMAGGWRVIKTLGMRMTKLRPVHGFCAETAAATSILISTLGGIPVSTTHVITGSIIGVGSVTSFSAVRWGVALRIVGAWLLTIPGTALVSMGMWYVLKLLPIQG
ncbi:MAG: inorganic phosphate transporter [Myxococcota bacterium]|jgi:PiT family inorganic phosphate transporter